MDAFTGEIKLWPVSRCPVGWMFCDGSVLIISQYQPLYALIGTRYGGDGVNNFAIPNLKGRVPIHKGAGPGTNGALAPVPHALASTGGSLAVSLTQAQMPAHTHSFNVSTAQADAVNPAGAVLAQTAANVAPYMLESVTGKAFSFNNGMLSTQGGSQGHNNIMPSMTLNYIICVQGVFPTQS